MTDMTLAEAIAYVRRITPADDPWSGDDFSCAQPDYEPTTTEHAIATTLNAVESGDLIPKADAEMAEAEVARLREALTGLLNAACGLVGFAKAVRHNSGKAYPWPSLDAQYDARAALTTPEKDTP